MEMVCFCRGLEGVCDMRRTEAKLQPADRAKAFTFASKLSEASQGFKDEAVSLSERLYNTIQN